MRSATFTFIAALVGLSVVVCPGPALASFDAFDTLTYGDGEIVATSDWNNAGTSLWYEVKLIDSGEWAGWYSYSYVFTPDGSGAISHFILEVTEGFDAGNAWDISGYLKQGDGADDPESMWYYTTDPSNPGLPSAVYGLKFDTAQGSGSIQFYSHRDPVPGDFYGKDGGLTAAWNADFGVDGLMTDAKILVPDGSYNVPPPTPEPAAWILLLSASAVSAFIRRRRS